MNFWVLIKNVSYLKWGLWATEEHPSPFLFSVSVTPDIVYGSAVA